MGDTKLKMEWVNSLPKMTFMEVPEIRESFINTNMKTRGVPLYQAETFYEKESTYLKRVIFNSIKADKPNEDLRKCSTFSLYACFQDMAINGDVLSFNPEDKLVYVEQRGYKAGRDAQGADIWEQRARMIISPYGELAIRMDYGQIKHADPAVVVRDGDTWDLETDDHSNVVSRWKSKIIGRPSNKIIGSFIKVTRQDGSFITSYLLQEDIDRLAAFSTRQNRGKTNALYGVGEGGQGIDAGFLRAKTLKHSFGTFPKVRLKGTNSDLDEQQVPIPDGMEDNAPTPMRQPHGQSRNQEGSHGPDYYFVNENVSPNGGDFVAPGNGEKAGHTIQQEEETF